MRNEIRAIRERLAVRRNPIGWSRTQGVRVGDRCRFLGVSQATFGSEPYLISIGDHVTITSGVRFITHDGGVWVLRDERPSIDVFGPITVGNNVFLGLNSLILPGTTIGDNVVVGAGSLVRGDVPSDSVVAGVPARVVSTLDDYRARVQERAIDTKGLDREAKRAAVEAHFGL